MPYKMPGRTADQRVYNAAEDAFTSEGGGNVPAAASQRERDMKDSAIRDDGLRYKYRGYHYDVLSDAFAYARLLRSRSAAHAQAIPLTQHQSIDPPSHEPTDAQRSLMASLAIVYEAGSYHFGASRYAHLADAVNDAGQAARRQRDAADN
jgi:hypothetical protein